MAPARIRGSYTTGILLFTCLTLITGGAGSEEVGNGADVKVVRNGTEEAVVLDCPHQLQDQDLQGVVIQWFHEGSLQPVYQWIPFDQEPQAVGMLTDRVDLDYVASEDDYHRHSSLRLLYPTTELSGRYTCSVLSFSKEETYTRDLIVYSEPQEMRVWTEEREEGRVTVVCMVEEVHPQPVLHILQKSNGDQKEVLSKGAEVNSWSRGSYNITLEKVVEEHTLDGPTEFECQVSIPKTSLRFKTSTTYEPSVAVVTGAVTTGGSMQQCSLALVGLLLPLLFLH